ncbi:MAG: HAD family hydrolase [bacterium]
MAIRGIIFDHDGTLVDSYEGIARCMQLTCHDLGEPDMTQEELHASIGPTLEDRFTELWGEKVAAKAARIYRGHYESHFVSGTRLLAGVAETLDAIAEKGILIACATNKTQHYCVRQLEHFGLMERMDIVIGFKQGFPPKPDPAMLQAALEKMGIAPDDAAMVGDTPIDVAAARAAGVRAWAVRSDFSTREEMERAGADLHFEQITNILDFL